MGIITYFTLIAATVVGTWNGNWFPSGRAEHRAHPEVEAATSRAAGKMLASALQRADPLATNGVIICLNEIRGPRSASNLVENVGRAGLRLASISQYRRRDRFDQQQDVIATTLPVVTSGWHRWSEAGAATSPRGFAWADLVMSAKTVTVCAVHLKSNYGGRTAEQKLQNRLKRETAMKELLKFLGGRPAIIAGDFNTDPWRKEFAGEQVFALAESAGFADALALLPRNRRGTHPSKRYGDSALDHILVCGYQLSNPFIESNDELSDHFALFVLCED